MDNQNLPKQTAQATLTLPPQTLPYCSDPGCPYCKVLREAYEQLKAGTGNGRR